MGGGSPRPPRPVVACCSSLAVAPSPGGPAVLPQPPPRCPSAKVPLLDPEACEGLQGRCSHKSPETLTLGSLCCVLIPPAVSLISARWLSSSPLPPSHLPIHPSNDLFLFFHPYYKFLLSTHIRHCAGPQWTGKPSGYFQSSKEDIRVLG